jgi:magnesium transporter
MTPRGKEIIPTDQKLNPGLLKENTWIHLTAESELQLQLMLADFYIHPLTMEDILNEHSRVKLEEFANYTFFILRGYHLDRNALYSKNFNFLIMKKLLITFSTDFRNTVYDIIDRWRDNSKLLSQGHEFIIHKIMDVETDHTLSITYRIEDKIEQFESHIFREASPPDLGVMYALRGNLQNIKKGIFQNKEVLEGLDRIGRKLFSKESEAFFRDLKDHSYKILESVDTNIESISSAVEAYMAISTRKTNQIMQILTVMTAIMLPMTLIAGIFGMNFEYIPTLKWKYGYHTSLIGMVIVGIGMMLYFKVKKWI